MSKLNQLDSHFQQQQTGLKLSKNPFSPIKLGKIQTSQPNMTHTKQMTSLTTKSPTRNISKTKEMSQIAYLSQNGQTGKRTKDKIAIMSPIIIVFLDQVVSNLKEANFFYFQGAVDKIGYNIFGYLAFTCEGLLKKIISSWICFDTLFNYSSCSITVCFQTTIFQKSSSLKYQMRLFPTLAWLNLRSCFLRNLTKGSIFFLWAYACSFYLY